MPEKKTEGQILQEKLFYNTEKRLEDSLSQNSKVAQDFCENYKRFLDSAKTEREFVREAEELAKDNGFINLDDIISANTKLKSGMKVYKVNKSKSIIFTVIGKEDLSKGINMLGAHIDSPRIDLKPNPLYEDTNLALLKTHYYGGIKKYQWTTIPLALHGVICKTDGSVIELNIGEKEDDPVFTITDLLPHLASKQMQKKAVEVVAGEELNILFGSSPYQDQKIKEKVKLNILKLLNERYGITEEDFISAELEIVPAFKAKDVGLDRSMVGAYGQDDRVCAYTTMQAILNANEVEKTSLCILTDKEEVGSMGNTGAESVLMENFIAEICNLYTSDYSDIYLRRCLSNSKMLSADVNPAIDPTFSHVHEKKNSSFLGKGLVLQKYTGVRGKSGGSDANAEYMCEVRRVLNENNIPWQSAELGKVDEGGGGTIAQFVANLGVEVVDCGVPILSMHAPFEVTSKIDIYISYLAYKAFLKDKNI